MAGGGALQRGAFVVRMHVFLGEFARSEGQKGVPAPAPAPVPGGPRFPFAEPERNVDAPSAVAADAIDRTTEGVPAGPSGRDAAPVCSQALSRRAQADGTLVCEF